MDSGTALVDQDIAALRQAGIGVVLVGPIRSLEGFGRLDVDRFDKLYVHRPVDVSNDASGRVFLLNVLRTRASITMLPNESAELLVRFSGGSLRDLISLAKSAGDEAYLRGADCVEVADVHAAADHFGRTLMVGLLKSEIQTLQRLRSGSGFVRVTDEDLALIATRRILEYTGKAPRYVVHPTIAPLLDMLGDDT